MADTIRISIGLDRDWVQEKRKKIGNPVRMLEKCVTAMEGASLVTSTYSEMTAMIPEERAEQYLQDVMRVIVNKFEEPRADEVVKVMGVEADLTKILQELNSLPQTEATVPEKKQLPETDRTSEKETHRDESSQEKTSTHREKTQEQKAEAAKEQEEELTPAQQESYEEYLKSVCNTSPVKYTPSMADFLMELGHVIPALKAMHAIPSLWNQSLLVSIHDGYGYSSFLQAITKILKRNGLLEAAEEKAAIREMTITQPENREERYNDWKRAADMASQMSESNRRRISRCILSLDISQWQSELNSTEVSHYLRKIEALATNFLIVYRIPFMEMQVVTGIRESLNNLTSVRCVVACPASLNNLVDYMKERMLLCNCRMEQECDELLEQWIVHEKCDDIFFGYKTIDKMVDQLIYQKALTNSALKITSNVITKEDVAALTQEDTAEESPYELLNRLIGISEVKRRLREIVIQMKELKNQADGDKKMERPCIHMVFKGNPGTGKTTVARILAKIMKEEKVLSKGLFYEIQGRDLCGRYIGETAPKTSAYCRDAYGSILFIDEAYSLNVNGSPRDYGREAIATLVSEMENHRDDLCVILAGYSKDMEELLKTNPGLASRLPYEITFPNYSREELVEIFMALAEKRSECEEDLKETVEHFFSMIPDSVMEEESFGNARIVRNLFERVWGKAAYRKNLDHNETLVICKEDFDSAISEDEFERLLNGTKRKAIGF